MNADRIRLLREEEELTQNDMANILGVKRSAYSLWEINKNTIPIEYLIKLSNKYKINIDYFVYLSSDKYTCFKECFVDREELGKRIKIARKEINFSQEKLANKLNTVHSVISAYESGKTKVPTLFLIEIAKLTNKSLNWFLNKQ